jgi:hypothetical protein
MTKKTGGCLCGSVRYELNCEPLAVAVCHCRNCQKQTGSALSVIAVFPRDAVSIDGELKVYEDLGSSGNPVFRNFCPDCGSPVLTDTPDAQASNIIYIKAGTLDDISNLAPTTHYWTKSAQTWFPLPDDATVLLEEDLG